MPTDATTILSTTRITAMLCQLGNNGEFPRDKKARDEAREMLEAWPHSYLAETVPLLWHTESAANEQRSNRAIGFLCITALPLMFAMFYYLGFFSVSHRGSGHVSQQFQVFLFIGIYAWFLTLICVACLQSQSSSNIILLHRGIARLCRYRPAWELTPLMIEALALDGKISDQPYLELPACKAKQRAMLTDYLSLWCQEDSPPLTPSQRTILLEDLKRIASRGTGFFGATNRVSEAETNYCLAILQTLRYEATRTGEGHLDNQTRTTLERVPGALTIDDPNRRSLQEAIQTVLTQSR